MPDQITGTGRVAAAPRIDPDKLLELAAKREKNGVVTLSWGMMLQIVEQLREPCHSGPHAASDDKEAEHRRTGGLTEAP